MTYYSEVAADFHASYKADRNRLERLAIWREALDKHAAHGALAYDIGCGTGMLTFEIAPRADRVVAIDGSSGMLAIARAEAQARGRRNIDFLESRLPIVGPALEQADFVISSSVLEYLDSMEQALLFVKSILRPGGTLIFSVSNKDSMSRKAVRWVYRLTGRPRYFGLVRHFLDESDIRRLLAQASLTYVEHRYFGGRDRLNRMMSWIFPERSSTNMILVVAQRPAQDG